MQFTMSASGVDDVVLDLRRFGERIANPTELLQRIAMRFEAEIEKQFALKGRNLTEGWVPLKPETIERKRALGYAEPETPLFATGQLKASFREGGPNSFHLVIPTEATVGTLDKLGRIHDEGRGNVPQRKIVSMTLALRRECVKRMQRYIRTGEVAAMEV